MNSTEIANITPKLRFPEFADEWQINTLGEVSKFQQGTQIDLDRQSTKPFKNSSKFLRIENYTKKSKDYRYIESYLAAGKYISNNEVAIVRYGASAGFVASGQDGVLANNLFSIRPLNNGLINSFLLIYLKLNKSFNYFQAEMAGGAMPALSFKIVSRYKIAYPARAEQEKIVGFLTSVDERIALIEKRVELLQKYKKGVMQQIFSKKIRFKDDNGNNFPDWEETKLSKLEGERRIKLGRGNVISKIDIKNNPGVYPIYSSSVKNNALFGKYGKYMFDEELITWSIDGGGNFFYRSAHKFSVSNVSGWLRVIDAGINCKFLAIQLQHHHQRFVFDYQTKAHPSVIRKMYIIKLPTIEEQEKIADLLTSLEDKITQEKVRIKNAKQFKKALLQRMFV